jgi:hypothetical protein
MPCLKEIVKPSDFTRGLIGSQFQNREREIIAGNIIVISTKNNDTWFDFSYDDYCAHCGHEVTEAERQILDGFVREGYLGFQDGKYSVNEKFIKTLAEYIKQE